MKRRVTLIPIGLLLGGMMLSFAPQVASAGQYGPLEGELGCRIDSGSLGINAPIGPLHRYRSSYSVTGNSMNGCNGGTSGGKDPFGAIIGGSVTAKGTTRMHPTCGPAADPATPSHPATMKLKIKWRNSNNVGVGVTKSKVSFSSIDTTTFAPAIAFTYTGTAKSGFAGDSVEFVFVSNESWAGTLYPSCSSGGWSGFGIGATLNEDSGFSASYVDVGDDPDVP